MKSKLFKSLTISFATLMMLSGCGGQKTAEKTSQSSSTKASTSDVTSGASEQKYTDPKELKDEYDIIIVGAGGAGMSAALQAKEEGKNPVILEKMPVAGGNTMKASSGMNASETKYQKEAGIKDSNDKFYEETLKGGHGTNDKELLRYYVDHSASAIDWLDSMGIKLNNLTITGGMSEKRTHRPEDGSAVGEYLVHGLLNNIHEKDIPIFVNADVTEILENDSTVDGVKVTVEGKEKEVHGKAVVVTTGGYGANPELLEKEKPELKGYVTTNQEGSTGDGIRMIEKLGGQTVDMDQIQIHPTVQQDKGVLIGEAVRGEGGILVSQEGKRFTNEMGTRDNVSAAITALPEKSAYLIFDAGVKERVKAINFYEKQGFVKSADSIEALAKEIDMDGKTLGTTVTDWNKAVEAKSDTEFSRETGMDHALNKGPYYAIKIAPGIHYTMGGVKINDKTEVLNKDNQPITGLYAAGEVTGGLHGSNRIGGNSVGDIIVFGRQAGEQSAKFVK
ncbi:flavocytochrome c [Melissococcus sp. OM08-11BH]|uniref:flavocytochrome c n=1 Tax=Melissococcus sp. OM08-11BH TaxID=2293110 RepID=UPI000E4896F1|nr:flavocytochrome c [Melissococcus sp. OM08-11BH]RGI32410.1 flavocytochrome c [Melissococcus sp. OM08-11BH]